MREIVLWIAGGLGGVAAAWLFLALVGSRRRRRCNREMLQNFQRLGLLPSEYDDQPQGEQADADPGQQAVQFTGLLAGGAEVLPHVAVFPSAHQRQVP